MASGAALYARCVRPIPKPICIITEEFAGRVTIELVMSDSQPSLDVIEASQRSAVALVKLLRRE